MGSDEVVASDRGGTTLANEPANVLALVPELGDGSRRAYFELLAPDDPGETRVLAVNYARSPDEWLSDWHGYVGADPAECVLVGVGETVRSAATGQDTTGSTARDRDGAASTNGSESTEASGRVVRSVDSPDDLTGLGIVIGEYLSEWENAGDVLIAVDSLTVPLQYVDLQRLFRFLHVITNRARTSGASCVVRVNPDAHDEQTVVTIASLFDAVLTYEGDGDWSTNPR